MKRTASAPLSEETKLRDGGELAGCGPARRMNFERVASATTVSTTTTTASTNIPVERPTQLDLKGPEAMAAASGAAPRSCHVDTPQCDTASDLLASSTSSEWEEQIHIV